MQQETNNIDNALNTRSRTRRSNMIVLCKPEPRSNSDESQLITSEKYDKLIIGDDNRFDVVRDLMHAREHCCLINKFTCMNAALNGNLELLKWLWQMGCEWDELTCSGAALNGHLGVLKWLRENGCPWDKYVCQLAVEDGARLILQQCCKINRSCEKMFHIFPSSFRSIAMGKRKWMCMG